MAQAAESHPVQPWQMSGSGRLVKQQLYLKSVAVLITLKNNAEYIREALNS